jgi:O-antigen ligase
MTKERFTDVFLFFFFIAISMIGVFDLPYVGKKIQPAELFFPIILFILWSRHGLKAILSSFKQPFAILLLTYCVLNLLPNFFQTGYMPLFREMGNIYLCVLTVVLIRLFKDFNVHRILKTYILSAASLAVICIIGWVWATLSGTQNLTVVWNNDYPIVGDTFRASGFTMGSSALILYLLPTCLLSFSRFIDNKKSKDLILTILLFTAALLTFSKSLILLGAGMLWIVLDRNNLFKRLKGFVLVGGGCLFLFLTHYIPVYMVDEKENIANSIYHSEPQIPISSTFALEPTCYVTLKRTGIKGIQSAPFWGLGSGQSHDFTASLKAAGEYPVFLENYSPHSVPIRSWEENGLFGFIGVLLLYGFMIRFLILNWANFKSDSALQAFALAFVLILVESLALDLISYRCVWLHLSLFLFLYSHHTSSKKQIE